MKNIDYTDKIKESKYYLKNVLSDYRYDHTIRVGELARDLAGEYGLDKDKTYLAAIIHDIGKKREEELLKKYDISDYIGKEDQDIYFAILHSPLGYFEAREVLAIEDEDILNSVLYHTTGRPAMSDLEKIVYLADASEPGRQGEIIDQIRDMAFKNINRALVMTMDMGINNCKKKKSLIHPLTVEARNYYLQKGVDFG